MTTAEEFQSKAAKGTRLQTISIRRPVPGVLGLEQRLFGFSDQLQRITILHSLCVSGSRDLQTIDRVQLHSNNMSSTSDEFAYVCNHLNCWMTQ